MSLIIEKILSCDWCTGRYIGAEQHTAQEQRKFVREVGWKRLGSKDFCCTDCYIAYKNISNK